MDLEGSVCLFFSLDSGVHQHVPSVGKFHRSPGEAAFPVIFRIRGQRRREQFPADEILRFGMAPVHGAPFHIVRVILKKQVVFSPVGGKSIGIVDPAHAAGKVKQGQLLLHQRSVFLFIAAGLPQKFTCHTIFSLVG